MTSSEPKARPGAPGDMPRDRRRDGNPRQVPAPPNSRTGASYTRFIPREELQGFANWTPGSFGDSEGAGRFRTGRGQPPQAFAANSNLGPDLGHLAGNAVGSPADIAAVLAAEADRLAVLEQEADPAAPRNRMAVSTAHGPQEPAAEGSTDPATPDLQAAQRNALRAELHAEWEEQHRDDTAAQVQAARTQGYQDGYRDGLVALENFKESFARQTSGQIGQLVLALDSDLRAMEQQLAASVARVATELARQVVRSELALRPALVAQVAQEAMTAVLLTARHITVQLHPDDHALVADGCAELLTARGARLQAMPGIARGGCRVASDAGTVDARVSARWAQATQALGTGTSWSDDDAPGADA